MIAIVDYGMANLRSVQKAFEAVGHAAAITADPNRVARGGEARPARRRRASATPSPGCGRRTSPT